LSSSDKAFSFNLKRTYLETSEILPSDLLLGAESHVDVLEGDESKDGVVGRGPLHRGKPPSAVDVIVSKRPVVRCLKRHPAIQRNNKKSTSTITKLSIEESYSKSSFCYAECGGVINT